MYDMTGQDPAYDSTTPACGSWDNLFRDYSKPVPGTVRTRSFPVRNWGIATAQLEPIPGTSDVPVLLTQGRFGGCDSWFSPKKVRRIAVTNKVPKNANEIDIERETFTYFNTGSWRIHLRGPALGPNCYIGSKPIWVIGGAGVSTNDLGYEMTAVSARSARTDGTTTRVTGQHMKSPVRDSLSTPYAVGCGAFDNVINIATDGRLHNGSQADMTFDHTIVRRN
ncbi:hypothetical protein [Gordonia sp. CPCC 205333]|uniref:hypothetical protein n=1 Tax=Gordonia sp. CPCC 205333 TaxID=3140790 RepID=UPI003AF35C20